MNTAQILDAAKERLQLKSDYGLAKAAGINRAWIPSIRRGERAVPLHFAYWLAVTLELDPASVVAELEAQREKNPQRIEFWKSFLLRASRRVAAVMLALTCFAFSGSETAAIGGGFRRRLYVA